MTAAPPQPAAGSVIERARALAVEDVRPHASAMARGSGGEFPWWLLSAARRRNLCGLLVPAELGGAGATHAEFAEVIETVAVECASSAVILDVHLSVGSEPILLLGTEDQRRRYLPRLASGEWLAAFALSEPDSGSDAASLVARADRVEGGWLVRGTKSWITNAGAADLYVVLARTGGPGPAGISAFLVEATWDGVAPERPLHKLGLRGSWTAGLELDGVAVPDENVLGGEGGGFRIAMTALDSGRIGISAQATGIARGSLNVVVEHLRAQGITVPGGSALIDDAAAGHLTAPAARLAEMAARVSEARLLYQHAAGLCDAGEPFSRAAAIAKLVATDTCVEVAHAAVELCGPAAQLDAHPAAVRLRDAKASQIYEGTNQVQRLVIARDLLRG